MSITNIVPLRPTVVFAGNPNCGKTSLFNVLTGSHFKVANYPGVTVERKEATLTLPSGVEVRAVDLPGIYDLHGTALDEQISARALTGEIDGARPSLIVVVIDVTNLERNLFLVSQLLDLEVPIVIALNMMDVLEHAGVKLYPELLSRALHGVPVVPVSARKKLGIRELEIKIDTTLRAPVLPPIFGWMMGTEKGKELREQFLTLRKNTNCSLLELLRHPTSIEGLSEVNFEATEAELRFHWCATIIRGVQVIPPGGFNKISRSLDRVITHRFVGLVIFVILMAALFHSVFTLSSYPMDLIDSLMTLLGDFVEGALPPGLLTSLLVNGMIAGVGSVIVFLPQIVILFFLLGLLEDSGYLARAAFLMDRVMRPFGLQGRSFIPLLNAFACAIPAVLSTRTIPGRADRFVTILTAPFMSCSARLPVYTVLIGACIPSYSASGIPLQGLTLLAMYLLGVIGAVIVSVILKKTAFKGEPAHFLMEMPPYRMPHITAVLRQVFDRALSFLSSAGTVILASSVILWALSTFPAPPIDASGSALSHSFAGQIGKIIEPLLLPLGLTWEFGIAIFASFAAREVFVSALATVFSLEAATNASQSLIEMLQAKIHEGSFSVAAGLSLMVFYVFACQCLSTIAVVYRETQSKVWTMSMVVYMTLIAYGCAFITYRIFS